MRKYICLGLLCGASALAQTSADIVNDPTEHAWTLFVQLNAPVPNDPQGRVQWEKWMLAREVFADPNKAPVWSSDQPPRTPMTFESEPLQRAVRRQRRNGMSSGLVEPQFDPLAGENNETRMNKEAFDFIVGNNLYYSQGIETFARIGKKFDFPLPAMEVKAQWRRIKPADATRYHTTMVRGADGLEQLWGLTALHITTKELPNWFWTTFEHRDNPEREGVFKDVAPQRSPPTLQGTKWENYVLRGTQLDFTDSIGRTTRLASSQMEDGFQDTSSCITCHALATVNPAAPLPTGRINALEFFDQDGRGFVGVPDKTRFLVPGSETSLRYIQLDFVWAFARAKRRTN